MTEKKQVNGRVHRKLVKCFANVECMMLIYAMKEWRSKGTSAFRCLNWVNSVSPPKPLVGAEDIDTNSNTSCAPM